MSTSKNYHHGNVRDVTLRQARAMLEESPAGSLSVREVARVAGLSHAAPYKHFAERSDFLAALATLCLAELVESQRRAAAAAEPGVRLLELGVSYVEYGVAHPHAFALIFDVDSSGVPPLELAGLGEQHRSLLDHAVAEAAGLGVIAWSDDLPAVADALWSLVHGLTQLVVSGRLGRDRVRPALGSLLHTGR